MIGLVDCNNFFASCERIFRPELWKKPIAVLSNNDGCIVARSNEVKELGVPMGAPYFKYRDICEKNNVKIFSSNFTLYGDMSARVMQTVHSMNPNVEVYSVDEAFVDMNGYEDVDKYARELRLTIFRHVGIPTSIGVASTKTLAKAASEITKKNKKFKGVLVLDSPGVVDKHLKNLPVQDLWGVGRGISQQLSALGIKTAYELKEKDDRWIKKKFGVHGLHMVWELRGVNCVETDRAEMIPKSVIRSRSFGKKVTDKKMLREAVAFHATDAARKLRKQGLTAGYVQPYITTGWHQQNQYYGKLGAHIEQTDDSFELTRAALRLFDKIYKKGYRYVKAGILCLNIQSKKYSTASLFEYQKKDRGPVLSAIDNVNKVYGKNTLFLGSLGLARLWKGRKELSSNHYTTDWNDLPIAKV